jgi:hypothetical protein
MGEGESGKRSGMLGSSCLLYASRYKCHVSHACTMQPGRRLGRWEVERENEREPMRKCGWGAHTRRGKVKHDSLYLQGESFSSEQCCTVKSNLSPSQKRLLTWGADPQLNVAVQLLLCAFGDPAPLDQDEQNIVQTTCRWAMMGESGQLLSLMSSKRASFRTRQAADIKGAVAHHASGCNSICHGEHDDNHDDVVQLCGSGEVG